MSKSGQPATKADQGGQRPSKAESPRPTDSHDPKPRAPAAPPSPKKK